MRIFKHLIFATGLILSIAVSAAQPVLIEIATAEAGRDQRTNEPIVSLKLTEKSARLFSQITQENVGRPMHLRVDGKILMSPMIQEPVLGGSFQISNNFGEKQTQDIVQSIRAGSKVEIELVPAK